MRRIFRNRGSFGCLVLILAVVVCIGGSFITVDRLCYSNLSQRLPLYPNATIERRQHNLFAEFGMGNTIVVMTSPDAPGDVRAWYAVHTGNYLREALRNNTPFFRMAQGQVDVTNNPDGEGSQIILFGTCVN